MWVLPSRSRPHNISRLIAAWYTTGASTPCWLRLDDDDPCLEEYCSLPLPGGWAVDIGSRRPLGQIYNEAFSWGRNLAWWGFIADDVVPITPEWDVKLIEAAGSNRMAVPAGGHDPEGAPHFVLGGDLPRRTGWLCLKGLDRLYIDTAWQRLAEAGGALVRCPDVILEHRHFSNGGARMDETYRKYRKGQDRETFESWLENLEDKE